MRGPGVRVHRARGPASQGGVPINDKPFVDYYEVLQLAQNAEQGTIERVYRLLAKRYHPDNSDSGSEDVFRNVQEAYEVLIDPESRAAYDVQYDRNHSLQWNIFSQSNAPGDQEEDRRIFRGVLALLYAARRKNPRDGGLGAVDLEKMLGVPREHLEFPNWYLKKKGLIEILDSGQFAITVDGIDSIHSDEMAVPDNRLLQFPEQPIEDDVPPGATDELSPDAPGGDGGSEPDRVARPHPSWLDGLSNLD